MSLRFKALTGPEVADVLDDLARLRVDVFRAWPYLYDGDLDYERRYMNSYRESDRAIVVAAWSGTGLVGAATGTPMEDHAAAFAEPIAVAGLDPADVFYCAESVLRESWRGQGAGHRFFDLREAHARSLGRRFAAFCAVERPTDHPARPSAYRPLDDFWRKRGYEKIPGAYARFSWRDVGEVTETEKPLQLWTRRL